MKQPFRSVALSVLILLTHFTLHAAEDYFSMSLEELINVEVKSASGLEETIKDAPASIVVISKQQIIQRGYTTLSQIFHDLPGFDTYFNHSSRHLNVYQRGYRTPLTTRTLFLINGNVQNDLWSHIAHMQRQIPMANIQRIEILYGPAAVIYGPNAFLGVVNVITEDGSEIMPGEDKARLKVSAGSYDTQDIDLGFQGNHGPFRYAISAKLLNSEGPELDDFSRQWGFMTHEWLNNEKVWGPILQLETEGRKTGEYNEHAETRGVIAEISYKQLKLNYVNWSLDEGYGHTYTADRAQPAGGWKKSAEELGLSHEYQSEAGILVKTKLVNRETRIWGTFIEASPDPQDLEYSFISVSDWNSINSSTLFEQNYNYALSDHLTLAGGIKYQAKTLTKSYDLCGYWAAASCSWLSDSREPDSGNLGPLGLGIGIQSSKDEVYSIVPGTTGSIPADQQTKATDKGLDRKSVV